MKKMNFITLAAGLLLAGYSANVQAGAFSDLISKIRPTVSKVAAWRPSFFVSYQDAKLAAMNSILQKQYEKAINAHYPKFYADPRKGEQIGKNPKCSNGIYTIGEYETYNNESNYFPCYKFTKIHDFNEEEKHTSVQTVCEFPGCKLEATDKLRRKLTHREILNGYKLALRAKSQKVNSFGVLDRHLD